MRVIQYAVLLFCLVVVVAACVTSLCGIPCDERFDPKACVGGLYCEPPPKDAGQ